MISRFINWEDFYGVIARLLSDTETHNFGSAASDVSLHA